MNIVNREKEIRVGVNKKTTDNIETFEEKTAPAYSSGGTEKKERFLDPGRLAVFFFCALIFLMPIFALPLVSSPLASAKAVLFFGGILLTALFLVLSALQTGKIKIPKSMLLISCGAVVLVWLISALFSGNAKLSLMGKLYDLDTFSMIFAAFLALFFGSIIFQSAKRAFVFYSLLFYSSLFVFLFQFLHVVFGINIIPFNIFPYNVSNLIGGWNDFSIFFGFIGLLSLVFLETAKFGKNIRLFLYVLLFISFLAMVSANFFNNWVVFGVFSLLIFISALFKGLSDQDDVAKRKKFLRVSLFVLAVVVFFTLFRGTTGNINNILKTSSTEIRPSLSTTFDISKQSLKNNLILGTGPNTFLYNWLKFKPAAVNDTIFWNARFVLGFGYLPSMLATTGILGIVAMIFFLLIFLSYGRKVFPYKKDSIDNSLATASFLGAAYLWVFVVLYSPSILIFTMAFILTGIFLAMLVNNGKIGIAEISMSSLLFRRQGRTKSSLIFGLIGLILLIGTIFSLYIYSRKFLALNNYNQALKIFSISGDIDKTGQKLTKSIGMDKQDEYYRALSELGLISLSQILANKDIPTDSIIKLFQDHLSAAITYAQGAVKINPADPINWMQLGRVYESVVSLNVEGASESALNSYQEAVKVSPLDPLPFITSARVAAQINKIDEARKYLESAMKVKPDFADALFMLSQIEAQTGNLKEAISKLETATGSFPNNFVVFFQLGLLQYQNDNFSAARTAFERAIGLNNDYANARYFLGLIYDRQGLKEKAIEQFNNIQKTNPDNEEVKKILSNLKNGRSALAGIVPPAPAPEDRSEPPISEQDQAGLKEAEEN